MRRAARLGWSTAGCGLLALLSGCGTPGAPQPPSLRLAEPVSTLTAARAGGSVTLAWTNPAKTTDGVEIPSFQAEMEADLCRAAGAAAATVDCVPLRKLTVKPGRQTTVVDALPPELAAGRLRALRYWVVLRNRRGRTAGVSNVAVSAAGQAPDTVAGLTAAASAQGVVLRWQADGTATPVRLHRHVVRGAAKPKDSGSASASAEAADQDLMVDAVALAGVAGAVDRSARFDEAYSYTAQRVLGLSPEPPMTGTTQNQPARQHGKTHRGALHSEAEHAQAAAPGVIEVASPLSAAVTVETTDRFPPAIPASLAATYTSLTHSVDLSWTPDTEQDLAGYIVYRCEGCGDASGGAWTRVSPAQPVEFPAYSDAQAQPGRVYRYAVSAVDQHGNESRRSQVVTVSTEP